MEVKRKKASILITISIIFLLCNYFLWFDIWFDAFGISYYIFTYERTFYNYLPLFFVFSLVLALTVIFKRKTIPNNFQILLICLLAIVLLLNGCGALLNSGEWHIDGETNSPDN